ncbi:MAG: HemK2/MTQ2 family protein methyltransferase [archaeon]
MLPIYSPEEDSFLLSSVLKKEIPKNLLKNKNLRILEIGSGSGIQIKTLLGFGIKKQNIFACDINPKAVKHCKELGFNCIQSNLFEKINGKYNLIIFNSPYLPEDNLEDKDSRLATTGGKKGSEIINKFLLQSKKHLAKEGKIFLVTSSLTKGIKWNGWKKKILAKQKLFFEEIYVWELFVQSL